jgi:hypothetical protein
LGKPSNLAREGGDVPRVGKSHTPRQNDSFGVQKADEGCEALGKFAQDLLKEVCGSAVTGTSGGQNGGCVARKAQRVRALFERWASHRLLQGHDTTPGAYGNVATYPREAVGTAHERASDDDAPTDSRSDGDTCAIANPAEMAPMEFSQGSGMTVLN